jgi:hypothetical protein
VKTHRDIIEVRVIAWQKRKRKMKQQRRAFYGLMPTHRETKNLNELSQYRFSAFFELPFSLSQTFNDLQLVYVQLEHMHECGDEQYKN